MLANVAVVREDAAMDFAAEGLLDALEGSDRAGRERLLEQLIDHGFTTDELKVAVAEHRLALLPVDRLLRGTYTATDAQERTGFPAELMTRVRRLHGLPEIDAGEPVFGEEDLDAARAMKQFLDAGFGEEPILEIARVLGEGMARVAATVTAAFAETFLRPGDSELEVAERFATLAEQLTPALTPVLVAAFKQHLRESVRLGMLGRTELETGDIAGARELAVCFADLVGFTRLGGQVEQAQLGVVAGRLADLAASVTEPPVRLVKTIGDAAMFVSSEPGPLVAVALKLVQESADAELPSVRAGIALGPAVVRAGDYFGHSVNLASRVTGVARPGSVLCTREVRDAAAEGFDWSSTGRHKLKGVSGPVPLYRARAL